MKRCSLLLLSILMLAGAVVLGRADKEVSPDEAARRAAVKLFQSLTDEQKKLALKDFSDKERLVEDFPAGNRPGLPMSQLTAEQKPLVEEMLRALTSEYGSSRCLAVLKQTGENRRFLNFFGTPNMDKPFAWRLVQHHLTLVYAEFGKDKSDEFGPVLLGGNPTKEIWDDEEKILLELQGALSEDETKAVRNKAGGASGSPIGTTGIRIGDLQEKPRGLARKLLQQRLAVFSADRRKVIETLIEREGGVDNLRLAIAGNATKSQHEGGNYSWKIGGPTLLCDWQTVGKEHIHMTVRARPKGT
jgi:hypothetical protein